MLDLLLYADDLESRSWSLEKDIPLSYCFVSLLGFPVARHGDRVQQLQTWAHQQESRLASELATGGRDNRLSTGPAYVSGTGFRCDCARLGDAFLRSAICLLLRDTGEDGSDEATRDAKGIDGLASQPPRRRRKAAAAGCGGPGSYSPGLLHGC